MLETENDKQNLGRSLSRFGHSERPAAPADAAPAGGSALPTLATANDVREVIQYLKKRPEGVSVSEVAQPLKKRIFFPPKIAAYRYWGIVEGSGDRLKLTPVGWEFARSLDPEAVMYRLLLCRTPLYRACLEWLYGEGTDVVNQDEVISYWRAHHPEGLGPGRNDDRGHTVSFFHLCQAAELGTMTIGKRGQPARLRLLRDELHALFHHGGAHPNASANARASNGPRRPKPGPLTKDALRVFVSVCAGTEVGGQLRELFELCGVEVSLVARGGGGRPEQLPAHLLEGGGGYDAGVVVVAVEDCHHDSNGRTLLNEGVLVEIAAAHVLYGERVLLLFDEGVAHSGSTLGMPHFFFKGGRVSFESAVRLVEAVKKHGGSVAPGVRAVPLRAAPQPLPAGRV